MAARIVQRDSQIGQRRRAACLFFAAFIAAVFATLTWQLAASAQQPAQQPERPADNAQQPGENAGEVSGVLIRLSLPIGDGDSTRFIRTIRRAMPKLPRADRSPVLIIEFSVGQSEEGRGTKFHSANDLAEFLVGKELSHVRTVAYIPQTIKGHAVLVALACREIVMAPNAEIGDAGIDEPDKITIRKQTYDQIARDTLTVPPAVALKMLDGKLDVRKVVHEGGTDYVLAEKIEDIKKEHNVQEVKPLKAGSTFSGREARLEPRFVSHLVNDRAELADRLGVPPKVLRESPLVGDLKAVQITLSGEITSPLVSEAMAQIDTRVKEGSANFVVVRITSPGGNATESQQMASYLANLDPQRVRTVAYVEKQAEGDAAIIALACDEIIMRAGAVLGGDGAFDLGEENDPRAKQDIEFAVRAYREGVAKPKSRSWSIGAAILNPALKVYRYTNKSSGVVEYWSDEEVAAQDDPKAWTQGPLITSASGRLRLTADKAEEYGIISKTVDGFDELKAWYDLEGDPALVDPTWVDKLLRFLASPNVALFLLLIGGAAVYAELQTPGVGLGGMIAFICFLLFFWAKVFEGTAGALEILLFVAGLASLIVEIFVLPGIGMGIFALGGGLMIIVSLILASQTFIVPHNSYQLGQMTNSLLVVGGATVGTIAAVAALRRWLPHAPVFNRMLLEPPSPEEVEHIHERESLVNYEHLLGQPGTAATRLAPSGRAKIGEELIDVITSGEFIDRDTALVVVEVHGNRVVVASSHA